MLSKGITTVDCVFTIKEGERDHIPQTVSGMQS